MAKLSRRRLLQAGAAGVGAIAAGRYSYAQAQQGTLKIPIMFSLSGPLSVVGLPAKQGAEITAKIINRNGGMMGRTVEPVFYDDKANANQIIAAAREAVSAGFNYIGGGLISGHFGGLLPLLNETKTVLVTGGGSAPFLTNESFNRYLFPGSDNDIQRANTLAQLAAQKFPEAKVFTSAISESQSYIDSYKNFEVFAKRNYKAAGKPEPKFNEAFIAKIGTADFRTQLSQIAASDADAFYNFVVGGDGITFWKQARAFNLGNKFKAVIDQTVDFIALKALKKDMPPNLWGLYQWYHGLHTQDELSREVYKEYVAQTGDPMPSGYLWYGNITLMSLTSAMRASGGKTDTESLIDALETKPFQTIKGEHRFRKEDHLLIGDVDLCNVVPSDDDVGIKVADAVKLNTASLSPPPNPGKPYKI